VTEHSWVGSSFALAYLNCLLMSLNTDRHFFAFGAGARICIGRSEYQIKFVIAQLEANGNTGLSWIEMTKLIPSILMRFDVELADPDSKPKQHCW
jgi:hypothetical protein